jgi:hypothetical protein
MAKGYKTGGRQKAIANKATAEVRKACAEIVDDPLYRQQLLHRARRGKLPPAVEVMLWHYAKGKRPKSSRRSRFLTANSVR